MNNGIDFKDNELSDLLCGSMPLNEAYFGKTKELLAAEQQLDKFRNKYLSKYIMNTRVNSDPDLLEFDRMMEKIFGFGCFTMHIHNSSEAQCITMPIDYRYDYGNPSNNLIADERGYKFKPQFDYACLLGIYSGLIFNPEFTTPEIMSIVLHEIGHNFYSSINKPNGVLVNFYTNVIYFISCLSITSPIVLANVIKNTNNYRKLMDKTGKQMRENNSMPVVVYDVFVQVMDIVKECQGSITNAIRIISLGTYTMYSAIINGIHNILRNPLGTILKPFTLKLYYGSEQAADNFATMYGYGGELSTALTKLGSRKGNSSSTVIGKFDDVPVLSTIMHITEAPVEILLTLFDEHPNSVARVKDQMALLERELSKEDMDPKMVQYIKADLKECREALDVLIDCSEGIKDPYIAQKFYNKMAYDGNNFKGKIFGSKHKFEEYDKAFKRASE